MAKGPIDFTRMQAAAGRGQDEGMDVEAYVGVINLLLESGKISPDNIFPEFDTQMMEASKNRYKAQLTDNNNKIPTSNLSGSMVVASTLEALRRNCLEVNKSSADKSGKVTGEAIINRKTIEDLTKSINEEKSAVKKGLMSRGLVILKKEITAAEKGNKLFQERQSGADRETTTEQEAARYTEVASEDPALKRAEVERSKKAAEIAEETKGTKGRARNNPFAEKEAAEKAAKAAKQEAYKAAKAAREVIQAAKVQPAESQTPATSQPGKGGGISK